MFSYTSDLKDSTLTLTLEGRIDSGNAAEVETSLLGELEKQTYRALVLDLEKLTYISSAGLRVMLKIRKANEGVKLINLTPDVYDIFSMTGFTEMMDVRKAFRKMSVDGCTVIGRGAKGTVYRYNDDTIIKVYKDPNSLPAIENERNLATKAFVLGIPTAISFDIVKVGDSYGSVFELLNAKSFSQLIREEPENMDKYVKLTADLLRNLHGTVVKKGEMPDFRLSIRGWLDFVQPFLEAPIFEKLKALVLGIPEDDHMLHCDFHTNNVVMQNGETMLIDMDTLSVGHPVMELANVKIAYVDFGIIDPSIIEKFLDLPYETSIEFWNRFLPAYLGTNDEAIIKNVTDKIDVLVNCRLIRHSVRHWGPDSELGKKVIAAAVEKLNELVPAVDTLVF